MQLSTVHVESSFEKLFASELISRGIRSCCEYERWCMPFYGIFFSPRFSICNLTASLATSLSNIFPQPSRYVVFHVFMCIDADL